MRSVCKSTPRRARSRNREPFNFDDEQRPRLQRLLPEFSVVICDIAAIAKPTPALRRFLTQARNVQDTLYTIMCQHGPAAIVHAPADPMPPKPRDPLLVTLDLIARMQEKARAGSPGSRRRDDRDAGTT